MKLLKAMATIASFTMISRIAGMVRDMLSASILGAGPLADAFFMALKFPNFFRRIAGEGALSVSFIPLYSRTIEEEGKEEGAKFAGQVFSIIGLILSVFCVLVMILMPWVIQMIAPGFEYGTERYNLAVTLTTMTFPYLFFMSLTALLGAILNAHGQFAPFAGAPIIFNLILIFCVLVLADIFPTAAHAMAFGVTISGILQLIMMIYFIRRTRILFHFQRPIWPIWDEKSKKLFKLMGPGILSAGVFQINLFVDMILASLLPAGAISYLYYADRLNQLPLGIVGVAVGTALLPMLSRSITSQNLEEGANLFNRSLEFSFFAAVPASVALFMIPYEMVTTLFGHGKFSMQDVLQTSYVLMGYGIGLPAYIGSKVFMTVFWAHQDTMTPVKVVIITALSNVMLSLLLIGLFGVVGIAFSTGIVGWIQFCLLRHRLKLKKNIEFDARLQRVIPKIILCSCFMGIVLSILSYELTSYFQQALPVKILALLALLGGGAITYAVAVQLTGVLKISDIQTYMTRSTKG
ncbi:MAG: murein biosynthesis integral membrane protein MurJ [Alphaproteobacteria bacterium]|nr:murein biosynthesis integral membrane protein MurJ [Alphaproteobacteria bacterium]